MCVPHLEKARTDGAQRQSANQSGDAGRESVGAIRRQDTRARTSRIQSIIRQDCEPQPDKVPSFTGGMGQMDIPAKSAVGTLTAGEIDASRENGRGHGSVAPSGDRKGTWSAGDKVT